MKTQRILDSHRILIQMVLMKEKERIGGSIDVKVTIQDGQLKNIEIISAENEDGTYLETAKGVISKILDAQTPEVDVMSGATFSSTGIKDAVADALQKAGN